VSTMLVCFKVFDGLFRIGIFSNSSGEIEGCEPVNISETVEEVLEMLKSAQEKQEEEKHE
jgi:hypothetical protein